MKALRPFERARGKRAVLALLRGEWDEPMATLREIFDVEDERGGTLVEVFAHERAEMLATARRVSHPLIEKPMPPPEVAVVPPLVWRGPALRFEPVINVALLRRFNREHTTCIACGATSGVAGHHVIYRSVLRLDVRWNLIPLCRSCHLNDSPTGFHRLGGYRWLRLNRKRLPRKVLRNLIVVLCVIEPWIERGGREGASIVTRRLRE